MDHLVSVDSEAKELDRLLEGHKTIIIRGFNEPVSPFGKVKEGDNLFFITTNRAGMVQGKAVVKNVLNSEILDEKGSIELINRHLMELMLTENQLNRCYGKPYIMLIRIMNVQRTSLFMLNENSIKSFSDWLIIENIDKIRSEVLM